MFPIPAAAQAAQPPVIIDIPINPQDQRINESFNTAFDKITFLFFRVFNFIFPSLGPTVENACLRISNIWQSIKEAWQQEEIRKEMDQLRIQNHELQVKTRDYDYLAQKNGQLTLERDQLEMNRRELIQAKEVAENLIRNTLQQEANLIGRERHADQYRNIVVLKNQELELKLAQIEHDRDLAHQNFNVILAANQELSLKFAESQQMIEDLRARLPNQEALIERLDLLAKAAQRLPQTGSRSELDDGLDNLLPFLMQQIDQANENLQKAREFLPVGSTAAKVALQSFERIIGEIKDYLARIPQSLRLHANWNRSVRQLIFQNQQL
jgi:hypothetical protein